MEREIYKRYFQDGIYLYDMLNEESTIPFDMYKFDYGKKCLSLPLHKHNYYHIIIFYKGNGIHSIDFNDYSISNNTIFFLSPTQYHCIKEIVSAKGYVINFSKDFLFRLNVRIRTLFEEHFFPTCRFNAFYTFTPQYSELIKQRISNLYKTSSMNMGNEHYLVYVIAELILLLLDILYHALPVNQAELKKTQSGIEYQTYLAFMEFIENNYKKYHTVTSCAINMRLSLSTLNRNILKVTGVQASELLKRRIILEAKRMLKYQLDLSIKEIGYRLGFEDTSNFIKFFKNVEHLTPLSFRET